MPGQIGLESTPEAYVAVMVEVFREVRRVLRTDGTLWLNLGDSYASGEVGRHDHKQAAGICDGDAIAGRARIGNGMGEREQRKLITGLPQKNLLGIPWRVAFALQADGWYLRQDIIWSKPNPMPESVTDRCTKAHEYLFLLSKSARYHYDAEAIAESGTGRDPGNITDNKHAGEQFAETKANLSKIGPSDTRNRRSVWTVATQPFKSAVSYGKYRIGSRDCSVHDCQADRARVLECDAQQDVFRFVRNPGNAARPVQLPEGAVVSIPLGRSAFPSDGLSASGHNTENCKSGSSSAQGVIFGDIPGADSACSELLDRSFATSARTLASNTAPDASVDAPLIDPSAETECRILGIATFEDRPSGCSCYYAGKVEKRQDHFASFPPDLIEPCILAGCPKDCCATCGAPLLRETSRGVDARQVDGSGLDRYGDGSIGVHRKVGGQYQKWLDENPKVTTGWSPSCACHAGLARGVVLDPFGGAGTTGLVADRLQRDAILIELNPAYATLATERIVDDGPLFANVT